MSNKEIERLIMEYIEKHDYKTTKNVKLKEYGLNFEYDDNNIIEIFNQIQLTEGQEKLYNEIMEKYKKKMVIKKWGHHFIYMFKMYIVLGMSPLNIAKIYHLNKKTVEEWLRTLNIKRGLNEAMQFAKLRRNYKEIHKKGKQTAGLKYKCGGSNGEDYIRNIINLFLCDYIDLPYVVGCNNMALGSKEIDIPVIIINGNNIDKFAIEISGSYYHQDNEKDLQKKLTLESEGFKVITQYTESYNDEEEGKQIAINIMKQIQEYYSSLS